MAQIVIWRWIIWKKNKKLSTSRSQFGPNFKFRSRQLLLSTKISKGCHFRSKNFTMPNKISDKSLQLQPDNVNITEIIECTDGCVFCILVIAFTRHHQTSPFRRRRFVQTLQGNSPCFSAVELIWGLF